MAVRNIIIAPITEEIVYRSVLAPTLYIALLSQEDSSFISYIGSISIPWVVVYINPLWFWLAHFHHLVEMASKYVLIAALVQFTYLCTDSITNLFLVIVYVFLGYLMLVLWNQQVNRIVVTIPAYCSTYVRLSIVYL